MKNKKQQMCIHHPLPRLQTGNQLEIVDYFSLVLSFTVVKYRDNNNFETHVVALEVSDHVRVQSSECLASPRFVTLSHSDAQPILSSIFPSSVLGILNFEEDVDFALNRQLIWWNVALAGKNFIKSIRLDSPQGQTLHFRHKLANVEAQVVGLNGIYFGKAKTKIEV